VDILFLKCDLKGFCSHFFPLDGGRKKDGGEYFKTPSSALRAPSPTGGEGLIFGESYIAFIPKSVNRTVSEYI
jgi:hypothetical protein